MEVNRNKGKKVFKHKEVLKEVEVGNIFNILGEQQEQVEGLNVVVGECSMGNMDAIFQRKDVNNEVSGNIEIDSGGGGRNDDLLMSLNEDAGGKENTTEREVSKEGE
ncbi:unnamed protein product [Ilex paraguariensis]|uniref:Uncharacterized protein n=1 Tax=Ilex paraguariensis TaxID=185542 RepID=A0ABC8SCZ7_9AQUA